MKADEDGDKYAEILLLGRAKPKAAEDKTAEDKTAEQKAAEPPQKRLRSATRSQDSEPKPQSSGDADAELEEDMLQIAIKRSLEIIGRSPQDMQQFEQFQLPAMPVEFFGSTTAAQYFRLQDYLALNGQYQPIQVQQRGACMFAAFRRQIQCPEEYTNTHLRRQVIMVMVENAEYFFDKLKGAIAGQYGAIRLTQSEYKQKCKDGNITDYERETYNEPGPFSYIKYLEYMLKRDSWGDELMLLVLGMVFQIRITMLNVTTLIVHRYRHAEKIEKSDILMLLAGQKHYMAAGRIFSLSYIKPFIGALLGHQNPLHIDSNTHQ